MKIIIITDTHFTNVWEEKLATQLYCTVMSRKPDYIFLLGDLLDSNLAIQRNGHQIKRLVKGFCEISPVLCILGNHDAKYASAPGTPWRTEYNKVFWENELACLSGFYLLNNTVYQDENLVTGGLQLPPEYYGLPRIGSKREASQMEHLAGVCEKKSILKDHLNRFLERFSWLDEPDIRLHVLLTHAPKFMAKKDIYGLWRDKFDCCLCGHVHNFFLPNSLAVLRERMIGWSKINLTAFPPFQMATFPWLKWFGHHYITEMEINKDVYTCKALIIR